MTNYPKHPPALCILLASCCTHEEMCHLVITHQLILHALLDEPEQDVPDELCWHSSRTRKQCPATLFVSIPSHSCISTSVLTTFQNYNFNTADFDHARFAAFETQLRCEPRQPIQPLEFAWAFQQLRLHSLELWALQPNEPVSKDSDAYSLDGSAVCSSTYNIIIRTHTIMKSLYSSRQSTTSSFLWGRPIDPECFEVAYESWEFKNRVFWTRERTSDFHMPSFSGNGVIFFDRVNGGPDVHIWLKKHYSTYTGDGNPRRLRR